MNYFKLLGLEQKYSIDQLLLHRQYLDKQSLYHPDRSTNVSEKRSYLEKSMLLNEAYKTLKDDYLRAEYLLKLLGKNFDNDSLNLVLGKSDLEEILEINEIVDDMNQLQDLEKIENEKLDEKSKLIQELDKNFEDNNIPKALDLTLRLKYLTKLLGNIKLKIKHAAHTDK